MDSKLALVEVVHAPVNAPGAAFVRRKGSRLWLDLTQSGAIAGI